MSTFIVPLLVFAAIILIIAIVLIIVGSKNPEDDREQLILERLEEFTQKGEEVNLEALEMSQPFSERVIYPIARSLGNFAVKFTPQNALQSISQKIERAGLPSNVEPSFIFILQLVLMLLFGGLLFLVLQFGPTQWPFGRVILLSLLFGVLGFYMPQMWLTSKINKRQKEIRKALPDALDLLTICVEAGLGFDAAMAQVCAKWESELTVAFQRVLQEIQLGKLRRDALRDMSDRVGLPELTSFVAAVIQSEQLGVSLANVLHVQADQMRIRRRQFAEEEARKAPIKMIIPMALLIFPALLIVLLTPSAIRLVQSALFDMF